MIHAIPQSAPPMTTTRLGPNLSTNQPSTGTSQVSSRTKIAKAIWMLFRSQPWAALIGLTNRVQPYWRFAIIAMQTMPITSCSQRLVGALAELKS